MKTLNQLKAKEFKTLNRTEVNYKSATIQIERDFLNCRWYYSSSSHPISGVYYGNLTDLKKKIKEEYNQIEK